MKDDLSRGRPGRSGGSKVNVLGVVNVTFTVWSGMVLPAVEGELQIVSIVTRL